ncbi:MAG: type II toxin-antitoxin system HicB family antitoxin [Oscillospiraceae bacterium]|jgi:predicted RNase H-like HicB family nuclease|nr:type II toxin-antitoxin system HicB family antitoxin [Oscillospiraceae bacterium]
MKTAYPVIFTKIPEGYMATAPDFEIDTHGGNFAEAIEMARDAIGLMGIDKQDDGVALPEPSPPETVALSRGEVVSMVDIDFDEYRRAHDMRTVRRNVTLPSWLDAAAQKAGINVSATLQTALKQTLNVQAP